jgi:hypothetical protein
MGAECEHDWRVSTREELIEIVTRDPISSGGDEIWATDLVDAYRAEVLREAADAVEPFDLAAAMRIRRMADSTP